MWREPPEIPRKFRVKNAELNTRFHMCVIDVTEVFSEADFLLSH